MQLLVRAVVVVVASSFIRQCSLIGSIFPTCAAVCESSVIVLAKNSAGESTASPEESKWT